MLEEGKQYYLEYNKNHWMAGSEFRVKLVRVTTYGLLVQFYKEDAPEPSRKMRHINWNLVETITPCWT